MDIELLSSFYQYAWYGFVKKNFAFSIFWMQYCIQYNQIIFMSHECNAVASNFASKITLKKIASKII